MAGRQGGVGGTSSCSVARERRSTLELEGRTGSGVELPKPA